MSNPLKTKGDRITDVGTQRVRSASGNRKPRYNIKRQQRSRDEVRRGLYSSRNHRESSYDEDLPTSRRKIEYRSRGEAGRGRSISNIKHRERIKYEKVPTNSKKR